MNDFCPFCKVSYGMVKLVHAYIAGIHYNGWYCELCGNYFHKKEYKRKKVE
jgi:hypothetical protein